MLNLINGEFYKLKKSKSFYICCGVMVVMVLFVYGMLFMVDKIQQGELENGTGGVIVTSSGAENLGKESVFESIGILDVLQQMAGNFTAITTLIFTSLFVIGEFGSGAVKNLVGKGHSKGSVFFAKYVAVEAATAVMFLLCAAATFLFGCIFVGTGQINSIFIKDFIVYTLVQILMTMALNGIVVTTSEISRSVGAGIAVSIGIACFSSIIFSGLDLVFHQFQLQPSDYWLTSLMVSCPIYDIPRDYMLQIAAAVILWSVAAIGIGIWHFKKTDIKV